MTTTLTVLRRARELIATPEKWTQGAYARDTCSTMTDPKADDAVCWCLSGAIHRFTDTFEEWCMAADAIRGRDLIEFNDAPTRIHAEVLAALDRAIVVKEQEQ